MEIKDESLGAMIEQVEQYVKNQKELYTLQVTGKVAEVVSSMLSRVIILVMLIIFFFILMMGVSYWIGESLGHIYLGFLIVGGITGLVTLLLYAFRYSWLKKPVMNSVISQILNPSDDAPRS